MPGCPTRRRDIGQGRSCPIYLEPTVNDTAVLLVFYNPARFRRILKNMLFIIETLKEKKIPYFVAECVFHNAKPQIPNADLVLHSNSYMFYKEQLINKLETIVPPQYTKLVCMDGDILFDSPDWVDQVSKLLDKADIAQPFSEACWLTPDNTRIRTKKPSYAYAIVRNKKIQRKTIHAYHPGFCWAFKRSTFQAIHGLYDRAIIGNGDMLFVFNFFKGKIPEFWIRDVLRTQFILGGWDEYNANFKRVAPRVGFLNIKALHLFHGIRENRQYTTRYQDAGDYLKDSWENSIVVNKDGLYEFKDPRASEAVLAYFKRRNEDIPLKEAVKRMTRKKKSPPKSEDNPAATSEPQNWVSTGTGAQQQVANLPHA
jgi:hypothetical protein